MDPSELFGIRLFECRVAAEMSLGQLAKRVHYSKGYLSKIENGAKPPTATLAKLCDDVLGTGGALAALVPQPANRTAVTSQVDEVAEVVDIDNDADLDGEVWVMSLDGNGGFWSHFIDRRQALVTGVSALTGFAVSRSMPPQTVDERMIPEFRSAFDQVRRLGLITSPVLVMPTAAAHVNALRSCAAADPEHRAELLLLAARFAEYVGWMGQEAGDEQISQRWTARAVNLATAGGDHSMVKYSLVRRAEMALYRQDAIATVELARQAQRDPAVAPRILGHAARCEAQGHALLGDQEACKRSLDRATVLLDGARSEAASSLVLGSANTPDPVALATGWALHDLGQPAQAIEVLDRELPTILPTARRPRARFGMRRALAYAASGEVDQACVVAQEALLDAAHVDSATVRIDVRQLNQMLSRWRTHRAVRELKPSLIAALHTPIPSAP